MVTPFYSSESFWNIPIAANPAIDTNSGALVAKSVTPYVSSANFANTDAWGISLVNASSSDKTYTLNNATYYDNGPVSFTIPYGAQPTTGSDHHLVVINGNQEFDMWNAQYNASTDTWTAGSRFITSLNGWGAMASPGQLAGGAVAAGFAEMGGVVRPEEIAQGHIDHALSLTLPVIRAHYVAAPATATDGGSTDPNAIPEGAHLQLDPSFNVDAQSWPAWEKVIAKALQTYGAYVSDTGGSVAIYGQTDMNAGNTSWASTGAPKGGSLANLPWNEMRVIQMPTASTGTATNFDPSGGAGTSTTSPAPSGGTGHVSSQTIGTGAQNLLVAISEDAWQGDAQYTVSVDGKQIGGTLIAHALHSSGRDDLITVKGNWSTGRHTLGITFLNDAWGGTASTDRNLYVDGVSVNGTSVAGASTELFSNGTKTFKFPT